MITSITELVWFIFMVHNIFPSNILEHVAIQAQLVEGLEGVRTVLLHLYRNPNGVNNKTLSQMTAIPVPVLAAVRQELIKADILKDITTFTPEGKEWVRNNLGFQLEHELDLYNPLLYTEAKIKTFFPKELYTILVNLLKERPEPLKEIDQSRATPDTVFRRYLLMLEEGQIEGRAIGLLGDDDALSLVLAASGLPSKVTVFDIDQRILTYLEKAQKLLNPTTLITTNVWDLRKPFPPDFQHTHDVIFTDPPYTIPGARLFLHRGRELMKQASGLPLYLAFGPKDPLTHWNLQLIVLNYGFQMWQIWRQFNHYLGNLKLGQFSDLYSLRIAYPQSRLSQSQHTGELYTKEVRETEVAWETLRKTQLTSTDSSIPLLEVGYHIIVELGNLPLEAFNPEQLRSWLLLACQEAELTVIDMFQYLYPPHGLSLIIMLQESHISLHTWPEYFFASLDVFVCDKPQKAEAVVNYIAKLMKPGKLTKLPIIRGEFTKHQK